MLTIAITSGKGGVGKTTFAANLAAALQETGEQTTVFDADLQLANLDIVLGISPTHNLQHVVSGEKTLREIATIGPGGLTAITGASAVPMLMRAGPKKLGLFMEQIAQLDAETDILVFDTAAGLDQRVMTFMKLAQEVIVVVSPDPTSITDAYATVKTLFRKDPGARVKVVFNMANPVEARRLFESFEKIVWSYLKKHVDFLGSVRHDMEAARATRKRQLFVVENPTCGAAQDIRAIAQEVRNWKDITMLRAG